MRAALAARANAKLRRRPRPPERPKGAEPRASPRAATAGAPPPPAAAAEPRLGGGGGGRNESAAYAQAGGAQQSTKGSKGAGKGQNNGRSGRGGAAAAAADGGAAPGSPGGAGAGQWPAGAPGMIPAGGAGAAQAMSPQQRGQMNASGQGQLAGGQMQPQQSMMSQAQAQQPNPHGKQQFTTEVMLLQGDERLRNHRDALKARLAPLGASQYFSSAFDELEYSVRIMLLSGRFAGTQGIPETMLMPFLPERLLTPPSPFRTIAELASCLPWLLRVHQSMQWVQQMPNGLMTVQRLICPSASEMGGLAAPDGVLAVDWRMVDEVMGRSEVPRDDMLFRPGMAGDPRFPRGAPGGFEGPGGAAGAGATAPVPGGAAAPVPGGAVAAVPGKEGAEHKAAGAESAPKAPKADKAGKADKAAAAAAQ